MSRLRNTLTCLALSFTAVHALWPIPRHLSTGTAPLRLSHSFSINPSSFDPPKDLADAIARALDQLKTDQLAPLTVDRGASLANNASSAPELGCLVLSLPPDGGRSSNVSAISEESVKPLGERDESYVLTVPSDGTDATIQANSTLGLFRGLTTFGQLWYTVNNLTFTYGVPLKVEDTPAFVSTVGSPSLCFLFLKRQNAEDCAFFLYFVALQRVHARYCS